MSLTPSTLRPGLLVSLRTHATGNVSYHRHDLDPAHLTEAGQLRATWETERLIEDPEEHTRAGKVRGEVRSTITRVCAWSSFGLLCPESKTDELEAAITEARALIDAFNATARRSTLSLYVLVGRIAPDDMEAVRAINAEIATLMATMADGLATLDVGVVREAASKARNLDAMLSTEASQRLTEAVAVARKAARQLVKAGEQGAVAVDQVAIATLAAARTAFLDFDDTPGAVETPSVPPRMLDLEPEPGVVSTTVPQPTLALDMETAYAV